MRLRGITTITLLKSGVYQEDEFRGFGRKLVLSWSENMNKASTTKDKEEGNKVVGQGKEVNEESDHVEGIRLIK